MTRQTAPRPCGCPGAPRSRHLSADERAAMRLQPCPGAGRTSGPSRAERKALGVEVSDGLPRFRLPQRVGDLAAELVDAGHEVRVFEALVELRAELARARATR